MILKLNERIVYESVVKAENEDTITSYDVS